MFAVDRWADAFIAACAEEGAGQAGGAWLSAEAYAFACDGLAVLKAARDAFSWRLRYMSGIPAARKTRAALERALKTCAYTGGNRGVEGALTVFFLLVQKNHGSRLGLLCAEIQTRAKKRAGILTVAIETPEKAGAAFLRELGATLARKTGTQTVEFEEKVEPELLGGCRLCIGSERLDYSVAGSIRRFEKKLNVSAHSKPV